MSRFTPEVLDSMRAALRDPKRNAKVMAVLNSSIQLGHSRYQARDAVCHALALVPQNARDVVFDWVTEVYNERGILLRGTC